MLKAQLAFLLLVGVCGSLAYTKPTKLVWYPKDDGMGHVPAFIGRDAPSTNELCIPDVVQGDPDKIHFQLYTSTNPTYYYEISNTTESLDASPWDSTAEVKFFAHGFSSDGESGSALLIRSEFIEKEFPTKLNLVIVDWGSLAAAPWYDVAASGTQLVGSKLGHLLDFLVKNGYTTASKIHLMGHSLGAHVSGFAATNFQNLQGGARVPRISAFDPALPRFGVVGDECRLDKTDADFVDVIHTASGTLAEGELSFSEPRGHVDFYPNSGHNQPGCGLDIAGACSHSRSYAYYAESVHNNEFRACKCSDDGWVDLAFASCSCDDGTEKLGEWAAKTGSGIYFLTTNGKTPFAQG